MNQTNPYTPSSSVPAADSPIRRVRVRPIDLYRRAYRFLGDQYWLFLGITALGMLLASVVPFGLIMGPVLVGIFYCYLQRERYGLAEFSTMFKGFDNFLEPFIAFLIILAVGLGVMLPLMLMFAIILFIPLLNSANAGSPDVPASLIVGLLIFYPLMIAANILATMPFVFTFQLIADRNLRGVEAVKQSVQGVICNFWGVLWCLVVVTAVSFLGALMCYVPLFFLMPLTTGVFFELYRDIYGPAPDMPEIATAEVVQ